VPSVGRRNRKAVLVQRRRHLTADEKCLGAPDASKAAQLGGQANREQADRFAAKVLPVIREMQKAGITSLRAIASALDARGVKTVRGGPWRPQGVANVLRRGS
jgi:hypothetical protein